MTKISNQPYKGCRDFLPDDYAKQKYIFDKWRSVAISYGYQEYLTPVIEHIEMYEAKSGEDINKELFRFEDSGGRKLCLRPEMTPSVTRLVSQVYNSSPKPLRLFSIANFFRGERPQKGRLREFWQLNVDIFGENSILADIEILRLAIDVLRVFNPPKKSFYIKLNHRVLMEDFFEKVLEILDPKLKTEISRKLDKFHKLSTDDFNAELANLGLSTSQIENINKWMNYKYNDILDDPVLSDSKGVKEINEIFSYLDNTEYADYLVYSPDLIRGFDYYDGIVFEAFDNNPDFKRSLFGGGRYNGLGKIFGVEDLPAVGFAPGDVSIDIFLTNWNLWPNFQDNEDIYYFPLLINEINRFFNISKNLRLKELNIIEGLKKETLTKALSYANKMNYKKVVIVGEDEIGKNIAKIKYMDSGREEIIELADLNTV
ncbi:MAG: histidine--tRNA ligase [Candidatus Dojkabacteria bacterium]|nr:histidine--tRNA ligase [Candidatus Dojkabacteria bacterium]